MNASTMVPPVDARVPAAVPLPAISRPATGETLSVLTTTGSILLAKTWLPDGTIKPYDDAKNFKLRKVGVADIHSLHGVLLKLAGMSQSCVIRGGYIGDELALPIMRAETGWTENHVLRKELVFKDRALHSVMIDVDKFAPECGMDLDDPTPAIAEFIERHLPECFYDRSYHWQLSSSAGLAKNAGVLKVHLWFWLDTAYTSAELIAWRRLHKLVQVDEAVFRVVQPLYTANPVMGDGVVDPVTARNGLYEGVFGDSVPLVIDRTAQVGGTMMKKAASEELDTAVSNDPVAQVLYARGMVLSESARGRLHVQCPRQDLHTDGKTGATGCAYFPAFTNGYRQGNFKCMHAACEGASQHLFTQALGITVDGWTAPRETSAEGLESLPDEDDTFADVPTAPAPAKTPLRKPKVDIPEARHLCTDQANVQRLLRHFGKRLMVAGDRWYAWDGTRWVPDDTIPTRYAMSLSKIVAHEAIEWESKTAASGEEDEKNKAVAKALRAWSSKAEMRATIDAALALTKRVLSVDTDLLDRDPWLLNCISGTLDLRTGKLQAHDPNDYITKVCPVAYDPQAKCPTFDALLRRVFAEEDGSNPIGRYVLRWFGYCATGSTREQAFVVHFGGGGNGKSTILDLVAGVLGDYAGTAAPGLLVGGANDRHPTEIADLFGRRMVTAHESGDSGVLREDFVKQATGSDRIKARFMRADFFEFVPTHKLQLLTNYKPTIKGQDAGIWRRVQMLPYHVRFGTPEQVAGGEAQFLKDDTMSEKLAQERAGVLLRIVQGAAEWYREGLNPPDSVLAASGEYRKEQDRLLQFLNENCELGRDYTVQLTGTMNAGIYQVYKEWCKEGGFFALAKVRFLQEIERLVPGFKKEPVKVSIFGSKLRRDVTLITGVRLMQAAEGNDGDLFD